MPARFIQRQVGLPESSTPAARKPLFTLPSTCTKWLDREAQPHEKACLEPVGAPPCCPGPAAGLAACASAHIHRWVPAGQRAKACEQRCIGLKRMGGAFCPPKKEPGNSATCSGPRSQAKKQRMTPIFNQHNTQTANISPFSFESHTVRAIQIGGEPCLSRLTCAASLGLTTLVRRAAA